jgi:hypothetical protein
MLSLRNGGEALEGGCRSDMYVKRISAAENLYACFEWL